MIRILYTVILYTAYITYIKQFKISQGSKYNKHVLYLCSINIFVLVLFKGVLRTNIKGHGQFICMQYLKKKK